MDGSIKMKTTTFLISSHILSELVKITDSILIIDEGKIIKQTTREELNQEDLRPKIMGLTFKGDEGYIIDIRMKFFLKGL